MMPCKHTSKCEHVVECDHTPFESDHRLKNLKNNEDALVHGAKCPKCRTELHQRLELFKSRVFMVAMFFIFAVTAASVLWGISHSLIER